MNETPQCIYKRFVGFRLTDEMDTRLHNFSSALGRRKSDVIRYLLLSCLNAYEADREAIERIRQELY
jgi:predicted DNA-binding protein